MATSHHGLTLTFGLLGNFISFVVFLSPVPTFVRIVKKKSTEEFQSLPYVVALFSAMLWLFYALNKSNAILLITINSFGCFIEIIYIALFITFATKKAKKLAVRSVLLLNFGAFSAIVLISYFCVKASSRVTVLGWICLVFGICVFVAPLSIMKRVIVTRSVEFMPFNLSFFLTISAVVWLLYGLLLNDIYVAIPNVVGLAFGLVQMVLYVIYKYFVKAEPLGKNKLPQSNHDISKARPSETINLDIELQAQQAKRKPQPNEYDAAHGDSQGERQTEKITVSVSVAVQPHDQNKSPDMSVPILEGTNDIP